MKTLDCGSDCTTSPAKLSYDEMIVNEGVYRPAGDRSTRIIVLNGYYRSLPQREVVTLYYNIDSKVLEPAGATWKSQHFYKTDERLRVGLAA